MTIKFQVGKTYYGRMIGDSNQRICLTVAKRTEKTITTAASDDKRYAGRLFRVKVDRGFEEVLPLGNYSMAPSVRADQELTAAIPTTEQLERQANEAAAERRMWRGALRTEAEIVDLEQLRRKAFPHLYE